jgi:hypothetical protein
MISEHIRQIHIEVSWASIIRSLDGPLDGSIEIVNILVCRLIGVLEDVIVTGDDNKVTRQLREESIQIFAYIS